MVAVLLLIGIVVPLLVSTYDQIEPRLFGFPFFYWYQLALGASSRRASVA